MNAPTETAADQEVQERYVSRLRSRLARPKISVEDARDGMLDCYVSTYHTGVKHGLQGIVGVDASPDQVAQVTGRMFRDRLKKRGVSFDAPTVDALADLKEELDEEFHFSQLPVEVSATHDQVCSLLLAKADGLMEHHGDRTVLQRSQSTDSAKPNAAATPPIRVAEAAAEPRSSEPTQAKIKTQTPKVRPAPLTAVPPVVAPPVVAPPRESSVTMSLRQALASYLDEIRRAADHAEPAELLAQLDRARTLAQSLADFSR